MNMREAFEAAHSDLLPTHPSMFEKDDGGAYAVPFMERYWQMFQAGAAFAARECEVKARRLMIGPMERAQFATAADLVGSIRKAFPEAFK